MTQQAHTFIPGDVEQICLLYGRSNTYKEHTRISTEKKKEEGSKAQKEEIVLKTSVVTNLPVSATEPNRGLCLVPVPPRQETFRRFNDSPIPLPTLLGRRRP